MHGFLNLRNKPILFTLITIYQNSDDSHYKIHSIPLLGAFAKLQKVTITFVMSPSFRPSLCLSVCLSAWNNSASTEGYS
jgi:hypothetical protein